MFLRLSDGSVRFVLQGFLKFRVPDVNKVRNPSIEVSSLSKEVRKGTAID